jgi:TonB family protein
VSEGRKKKNVTAKAWAIIRLTANTLLMCSLLTNARAADTKSDPDAVDIDVFQAAKPIGGPSPHYPSSEIRDGKEGWVLLNMMVDPKGKPYEVTVTDSSGNAALEQAAVKGMDRFSFEPAKHRGIPIDSSFALKVTFYQYRLAQGASRNFATAYTNMAKAIGAGDKGKAGEAMASLDAQNLYEDAFRSYGKFLYDLKWGTESEQMADLRRAIAGERVAQHLPDRVFIEALKAQFALDVKLNDFGNALEVWDTLKSLISDATHDEFQPTVDRIRALQMVVRMSGQIDSGTSWNGHLFKNHFDISVLNGSVSEIKLRCKKKYLFFKYEAGVQYTVNAPAGECYIEVIGTPEAAFELAQS